MAEQLPFRQVQQSVWEDGARRLAEGAHRSVFEGPVQAQVIAEKLGEDPATITRMLKGKQNPSWRLLAFIHSECPDKHLLHAAADLSSYEARPKPPPSAAEELAAERMVLAEMGILDVVKQKAARLARAAEDAP
jgi:transcriptional regulator with XRE-family HTH domain